MNRDNSASVAREWSHADKSAWGAGPWQHEPDKVQWIDEATGLDCLLHRNPAGAWCGYVGVAEGHPLFGRDYDAVDAAVHGGLTYADFCQVHPDGTERPEVGICHVPAEGRPHRVWWLGFDCAHAGDACPERRTRSERFHRKDVYRTREYAAAEVARLARQIRDAS